MRPFIYIFKYGIFICLIVLISLLYSCDSGENLNKNLQGLWNVHHASRNGRITYTLEGTYLKFSEGKFIETNLYGDSNSFGYQIENNIVYPDSFFKEIFVDKIWDDTLLMHFTIDNNIFILNLINTPENENKFTR